MTSNLKKFWKDEDGASLVEYSLLIGIITVATVASIITMGGKVSTWWANLVNATP